MKLICDVEGVISEHNELMERETHAKMSGLASKALVDKVKKLKRTEKLCEIIRFFGNQEGDSEFCNMLHIMSGLGP